MKHVMEPRTQIRYCVILSRFKINEQITDHIKAKLFLKKNLAASREMRFANKSNVKVFKDEI